MPIPDAGLYLLLVLWGALVALDGASCGQFMISRPLVAATVAGWLAGSPAAGAMVGIVLEVFHLTVLPVGAARYPEGGPPAVAAGALFALSDRLPATLLTTLVFFLAWEWIGGESIRLLRQFNVRLLAPAAGETDPIEALQRRHLAAVAVDAARGMVLVAAGIPVAWLLLSGSAAAWQLDQRIPQTLLAAVVAGTVAGSLRLFGGRKRLFVVGMAAGLLLLLMRR